MQAATGRDEVERQDRLVPAAVVDFIRDHIDRLETFQVLMVVRGGASRGWTVRQVSLERGSSLYSAEMSMRQLCRAGLLTSADGVFRFDPQSSLLAEQAAWLIWWYQSNPTAVIRLLLYPRGRAS